MSEEANWKISVALAEEKDSPRFGVKKEVQMKTGGEKEGRHGKSHHSYFKEMAEHQAVEPRPISWEELAIHTAEDSAWLSLNGVVYDVTTYLQFHPGGSILLEGCGKQCAHLFNKYHPWVNGKHLLDKYKLGYLQR